MATITTTMDTKTENDERKGAPKQIFAGQCVGRECLLKVAILNIIIFAI